MIMWYFFHEFVALQLFRVYYQNFILFLWWCPVSESSWSLSLCAFEETFTYCSYYSLYLTVKYLISQLGQRFWVSQLEGLQAIGLVSGTVGKWTCCWGLRMNVSTCAGCGEPPPLLLDPPNNLDVKLSSVFWMRRGRNSLLDSVPKC